VRTFWRRTRFPIFCFLVAMLLALIGQILEVLFNTTWLTVLFWSLAATPFAVSFYRMRNINRVIYGGFESLIGFASLYVGIWKFVRAAYPMSFESLVTVSLLLWIAIYFMVRALDNIGVGLQGSKYEKRWQEFFQQNGGKV
jgi:hypothetical protein